MGGLDSFGGGLDELSHVIWVRDHRHVAGRDFDGVGAHALGELPLGIGRDRLIVLGDQEPGRVRFPCRPCGRRWSAGRVRGFYHLWSPGSHASRQELRGWVRGFVPLHGERAAQIGTDGEAAVQAGEVQQPRDRDAGSGQAHDDAEHSGAALRADQHG